MKKLLTGILLFCFWQSVQCGIIRLINDMNSSLKFVVMPAYDDWHEIKSMVLEAKKSGVIIVDVSKGERLWVAYYGTWCKLPEKKHYRNISLRDNKNYNVKIKNIASPLFGGRAIYHSELTEPKFVQTGVVVDDTKGIEGVKSVEIVSSASGMEPTLFYQGKDVLNMYNDQCIPLDVYKECPKFFATFNRSGKPFESERRGFYKHSRISMNTHSGSTYDVGIISPIYIIEFDPSSVNKLPKDIQDAIITKYHGTDLSNGLYTGLTELGVNIFVTSCAFGPIPVALSIKGSVPNFNLNLFGFKALGHGENDSIYIGLFQNKGIDSWDKNPMAKDQLGEQKLLEEDDDDFDAKDIFGCTFNNYEFASFCTVAITKDCKNILVTLVLVVDSVRSVKELSDFFLVERTFSALLTSLASYAKTFDRYCDREVLEYMINSLVVLSSAGTISHSTSTSSTSGGYTSSSSSAVSTHSQPTSSTTSDTKLASYAKTFGGYCDGEALEYMINSLEDLSSASTISHSASTSSTSGGYTSSSSSAVGTHSSSSQPTSSIISDNNKL